MDSDGPGSSISATRHSWRRTAEEAEERAEEEEASMGEMGFFGGGGRGVNGRTVNSQVVEVGGLVAVAVRDSH